MLHFHRKQQPYCPSLAGRRGTEALYGYAMGSLLLINKKAKLPGHKKKLLAAG